MEINEKKTQHVGSGFCQLSDKNKQQKQKSKNSCAIKEAIKKVK